MYDLAVANVWVTLAKMKTGSRDKGFFDLER